MERGFGGGQPCGLAAAPQNSTDSQSETLCIELVLPLFAWGGIDGLL
jgi:hypothetical protein